VAVPLLSHDGFACNFDFCRRHSVENDKSERKSVTRKLLLIIACLVGLATGFFVLAQWRLYQRIPKNHEWNAVNRFLEEGGTPDDLLLFEPSWLAGYAQDRGRLKNFSVVRKEEIFNETFPPSSRLWLVSIFKKQPLAERLKNAGFVRNKTASMYSVQLSNYSIPRRGSLYNFEKNLRKAYVFIDYADGRREEAVWKRKSWTFPSKPSSWNQVSSRLESFRGERRRCIWLHPVEGGKKTLQFSDVELGDRLEIFGGIVDSGRRYPPLAPVFLTVQVDSKPIGRLTFKEADDSFHRMIDTSGLAGRRHQVSFQVESPSENKRYFCFATWSES